VDFRCRVDRRSSLRKQRISKLGVFISNLLLFLCQFGHVEVKYLDLSFIENEHIGGVHVSVDDPSLMYVLDSFKDLLENRLGIGLRDGAMLDDMIEDGRTSDLLHHYIAPTPQQLWYVLDASHDVGMTVQLLHYLVLLFCMKEHLLIFTSEDLDCTLLSS